MQKRVLKLSQEFYDIAVNIARYHHEKYNGQGYPRGLSGKSIPIEARIMALADVFDPEIGELFLNCRLQLESFYDKVNET